MSELNVNGNWITWISSWVLLSKNDPAAVEEAVAADRQRALYCDLFKL